MASGAAKAGGDVPGDSGVEEAARQLEELNVGDSPSPRVLPKPEVQRIRTEGRRFVYFDLETTGLGRRSHITQIAAHSDQDETFSSFVLPKIPISQEAQNITGISCTGQHMYHHGNHILWLKIKSALEAFIDFLGKEPVVILGHNIQRFDCPILLNALQACGLVERFQKMVYGCVDTYLLFRQINSDAQNHKLATLYEYYTGEDFQAHDAREDVRALKRIVAEANPGHENFSRHSFTFKYIIQSQSYSAAKAKLLPAWLELVNRKVISKYMADCASGSGLSWDEVQRIFQREGEERVRAMLKERLTHRTAAIDGICQYLRGERVENA